MQFGALAGGTVNISLGPFSANPWAVLLVGVLGGLGVGAVVDHFEDMREATCPRPVAQIMPADGELCRKVLPARCCPSVTP